MPPSTSALSSRWRLDGEVPRNCANSERYHHFSGCVSVAASTSPRTVGNSAANAAGLRITRRVIRRMRNSARAPRTCVHPGTWCQRVEHLVALRLRFERFDALNRQCLHGHDGPMLVAQEVAPFRPPRSGAVGVEVLHGGDERRWLTQAKNPMA